MKCRYETKLSMVQYLSASQLDFSRIPPQNLGVLVRRLTRGCETQGELIATLYKVRGLLACATARPNGVTLLALVEA